MLGRLEGTSLSPSLFCLNWQKHGCVLKTQLQKDSLQLIRFAVHCQDKGQGQSPEEEVSLGNHASSGSSSGIQGERFSFPPKSISIAEIVAKCWRGDSHMRGRTRKFKFLPRSRELFPLPFISALEYISST